jgi:hypothetical protein
MIIIFKELNSNYFKNFNSYFILIDSIDYLSSSWTNIFKTGNETDQDSLNIFRQFHCADCLNSFQQQLKDNKSSSASNVLNQSTKELLLKKSRSRMNTPPPPLQPITDEPMNGLNHYFGQPNNQPPPQLHLFNSSSSLIRNLSNSNLNNTNNNPSTIQTVTNTSQAYFVPASNIQIINNPNNSTNNQNILIANNYNELNNSMNFSSSETDNNNMNQTQSIQDKKQCKIKLF